MVISSKYSRGLRRKISRYPMSQRKAIRTQLSKPKSSLSGKYSNIMRYASSKPKVGGVKKWYRRGSGNVRDGGAKKKKKPWYKRGNIKKVVGSKTVRGGVATAAALGIAAIMIPKDIISNVAENVQNTAENIYETGKNIGGVLGSVVEVVGTSADVLSNGLAWLSSNLGIVVAVGGGVVVLDRVTR